MDLVEKVAIAIYLHQGGVAPDQYEEVMGVKQRLWKTAAPWDSQPEIELCEHERDEYRFQAEAAIKAVAAALQGLACK